MSMVRTVDEVVGTDTLRDGTLVAVMRSGRVWSLFNDETWCDFLPPVPGTEAYRVELAARREAADE